MAVKAKSAEIINGVNTDDLFATVHSMRGIPSMANFTFHVRNTWVEGGLSRSVVGEFHGADREMEHKKIFTIDADKPPVLLGRDIAPNPVEHLLHALAACVTTSMVYHAAARGMQIDEIESSVEGDIDLHGFFGLDKNVRKGFQKIRMNFKIKTDASDDELRDIVRLGPAYSPVFDSLANGIAINVEAERM